MITKSRIQVRKTYKPSIKKSCYEDLKALDWRDSIAKVYEALKMPYKFVRDYLKGGMSTVKIERSRKRGNYIQLALMGKKSVKTTYEVLERLLNVQYASNLVFA
jgi:molybdenum-dependent DNA-binding transcriptional regulator ModE